MDPKPIESVIDKIAEKLGVAVEKLQPLAEHVAREYQIQGAVAAAFCASAAIACVILLAWILRTLFRTAAQCSDIGKWNDKDTAVASASAIGGTAVLILGIVSAAGCYVNLCRACAPTYYCLRELLK